jgi:hypothetical protein
MCPQSSPCTVLTQETVWRSVCPLRRAARGLVVHACKCSDESARHSGIVSINDRIFLRSRVCHSSAMDIDQLIGVAYAAVRWLRATERHWNPTRGAGSGSFRANMPHSRDERKQHETGDAASASMQKTLSRHTRLLRGHS